MKIAVLITTFNRKEKTLRCIESLKNQVLTSDITIEIYVTDDASVDGTPDIIRSEFPEVNLFKGTGSLYWAGGMRFTWRKALLSNADYFLLLNDDTVLSSNALSILLFYTTRNCESSICVGSTVDNRTHKISYGGRVLTSKIFWRSSITMPTSEYLECDFGNANIMLVHKGVVDKIGILSEAYTHSLADYDYTLNARKAGFKVVVAPGFLGECIDDHGNNWQGHNTSIKQRLEYLKSPKGLAYKEYLAFIKKHFPLSLPSAFCKLWLKTFFPFIWDTLKK